MGANPVTLTFDDASYRRCLAYLHGLNLGGAKVVASALTAMAHRWQREVVRHAPVDMGTFRASIAVDPASPDTAPTIIAQVGTNVDGDSDVPYPVELEFNPTGHIAGGRVQKWKPGDAPILDWPAKDRPIQAAVNNLLMQANDTTGPGRDENGRFLKRGDTEGEARARERAAKKRDAALAKAADLQQKAYDVNTAEFMPPFRGSWQMVAPELIVLLRKRLAEFLRRTAA